jgi:hypothetical protein
MRTIPTGRASETVEVYDARGCSSCGRPFAHGSTTVSWLQCCCAGTTGHRTWYCFACHSWTYDPPHAVID